MESIAERLKFALENLKVTPYALAKEMRVSESTISRILNGKTTPSDKTIIGIVEALSINSIWLQFGLGNFDDQFPIDELEKAKRDRFRAFLASKKISMDNLGKLSPELWRWVMRGKKMERERFNSIQKIFPDINLDWLSSGQGAMADPVSLGDIDTDSLNLINDPDLSKSQKVKKSNSFKMLRRKDDLEFILLMGSQILIISPLVSSVAYSDYVVNRDNPIYISELPKHGVVLEKLFWGGYRSFEVVDDSMKSDTEESIFKGNIVTGRRVEKFPRKSSEFTAGHEYIVVQSEGVQLFKIVDVSTNNEFLICNKAKSKEDIIIPVHDVLELYRIYAVTQYRNINDSY